MVIKDAGAPTAAVLDASEARAPYEGASSRPDIRREERRVSVRHIASRYIRSLVEASVMEGERSPHMIPGARVDEHAAPHSTYVASSSTSGTINGRSGLPQQRRPGPQHDRQDHSVNGGGNTRARAAANGDGAEAVNAERGEQPDDGRQERTAEILRLMRAALGAVVMGGQQVRRAPPEPCRHQRTIPNAAHSRHLGAGNASVGRAGPVQQRQRPQARQRQQRDYMPSTIAPWDQPVRGNAATQHPGASHGPGGNDAGLRAAANRRESNPFVYRPEGSGEETCIRRASCAMRSGSSPTDVNTCGQRQHADVVPPVDSVNSGDNGAAIALGLSEGDIAARLPSVLCPISSVPLDRHTSESSCVLQHFKAQREASRTLTPPMTNQPTRPEMLENHALRKAMHEWVDARRHQHQLDSQEQHQQQDLALHQEVQQQQPQQQVSTAPPTTTHAAATPRAGLNRRTAAAATTPTNTPTASPSSAATPRASEPYSPVKVSLLEPFFMALAVLVVVGWAVYSGLAGSSLRAVAHAVLSRASWRLVWMDLSVWQVVALQSEGCQD